MDTRINYSVAHMWRKCEMSVLMRFNKIFPVSEILIKTSKKRKTHVSMFLCFKAAIKVLMMIIMYVRLSTSILPPVSNSLCLSNGNFLSAISFFLLQKIRFLTD